ncbi:homeobox protein Hox-D12a [Dunckerocampus dactyliophorus]|uniref:homeobox protein Hox-D12a n=1 Tax=Dunckerocampus dactyliophorus TaxID=161453 RepID=UPI002406D565|nr:homeobox protein Hox-D12a [Dunckerocampus dactyliophorus]
MAMCERNPLNPGYVGPLLNLAPTPESLYLSNLRGNGAHMPALHHHHHHIPFNRRAELCTLPWPASSSCTSGPVAPPQNRAFGAYCPPFRANPTAPVNNNNPAKAAAPEEPPPAPRCLQGPDHKAPPPAGPHQVYAEELQGHAGGLRGYLDVEDRGSAIQLEQDSAGRLHANNKQQARPPSALTCTRSTFAEGGPWCSSHLVRSRKKRKPYSKPQLAELESEFLLNEFINRQKRKELSDRLDLSDQQVKIWFQNRRMKKKRLLMREQAFGAY